MTEDFKFGDHRTELRVDPYPKVKPWLIGESNPYGGAPGYALYPEPPHCAGWRLCHKVLELEPMEYFRRFERRNLLEGGRWSVRAGRAAAGKLLEERGYAPLVLLGAKVAEAFGLRYAPFTFHHQVGWRAPAAIIPHPSGLSRAWNDPGAFAHARQTIDAMLRWCAAGDEAPSAP